MLAILVILAVFTPPMAAGIVCECLKQNETKGDTDAG